VLPFFLAYIDPGSGSFLIQMASALFFGSFFFVRRLRAAFSRVLRRKEAEEQQGDS
jgi:hypothetical protein